MMKLERLQGQTGYIETTPAVIPVYQLSEREIVLFDSGAEPSEELLELLEQKKLRVRAVVCTHLHVDHIANNDVLVARHGTQIFAHSLEIPRFQAKQRVSYPITAIEDANVLDIDGVPIRLLFTPGHTEGHLACVTPDGVCCVGDAIMAQSVLEHSKIPYMDDVDQSMISMELIRQSVYPFYLVAHKGVIPRTELSALVDQNIQKELDLYALLRQQITKPTAIEQVATDFIRAAGVRSQKMLETDYVRHTAKVRIFALVNAGEFSMEDGLIVPKRFSGYAASSC